VHSLQGRISGVRAAILGIEHCGLVSVSALFDALIVSAAAKRLNLFRLTLISRSHDVIRYEYRLVTSKT
jgi:hypothetical protein